MGVVFAGRRFSLSRLRFLKFFLIYFILFECLLAASSPDHPDPCTSQAREVGIFARVITWLKPSIRSGATLHGKIKETEKQNLTAVVIQARRIRTMLDKLGYSSEQVTDHTYQLYKAIADELRKISRQPKEIKVFYKAIEIWADDVSVNEYANAIQLGIKNFEEKFSELKDAIEALGDTDSWVGVGFAEGDMTLAAIASRASYLKDYDGIWIVNLWGANAPQVASHIQAMEIERQEIIKLADEELGTSEANSLFTTVRGQKILKPELNSILKKTGSIHLIRELIYSGFQLSSSPSEALARKLRSYSRMTRALETQLEQLEDEVRRINPDTPLTSEEFSADAEWLVTADVIGLSGLNMTDVEANAAEAAANLSHSSVDDVVKKFRFTNSLNQLRQNRAKFKELISQFTNENKPPELRLVGSHFSGDESTAIFAGPISEELLSRMRNAIGESARITVYPARLKDQTSPLSRKQISLIRKWGEKVNKIIEKALIHKLGFEEFKKVALEVRLISHSSDKQEFDIEITYGFNKTLSSEASLVAHEIMKGISKIVLESNSDNHFRNIKIIFKSELPASAEHD